LEKHPNIFAWFGVGRGSNGCNGPADSDSARQKNTLKENMKIQHLLQIISVSALFAVVMSLTAGETLRSPRAQGNQSKIVAAVDNSPSTVAQNQTAVTSPRTLDNQIKTVAGTGNGAPTMDCSRKMVASPKAIGECAGHPGATMSCCAVATAK